MKFSVRVLQDSFLVGEAVELFVTLVNDEALEVQAPDPAHSGSWEPSFRLFGPGREAGEPFDRFRVVRRKAPAPGATPPLLRLAPGESSSALVPLEEWLDLATPGVHRLEASVAWAGGRMEATPIEFEILRPGLTRVAVSNDVGPLRRHAALLTYATPVASGWRRLEHPALLNPYAGWTVGGARALGDSSEAPTPLGTVTPHERESLMVRWRVWQEGRTLVAQRQFGEPLRLDLGPDPVALVDPAVFDQDGTLDVYGVTQTNDAPQVRAWRVSVSPWNGPPQVTARWDVPLTAAPASAAVAVNALSAGGPLHLAFASATATGTELTVLANASASAPAARTHTLEAVRPLPGALALRSDDDGAVSLTLLAFRPQPTEEAPTRGELLCVDAAFAPSEPDPLVTTRVAAVLDTPPAWGAMSYGIDPRARRREWLAVLGPTQVLSPRGTHSLSAPLALPPRIVASGVGLHALVVDPSGPPRLEALR